MSAQAPRMDVKVLYTLDSSPTHTMVARLGRPVPVEVIIPNMTPPSPLTPSGSNYHQIPPQRQVRFGRIPLKTCLGAVCMASPELLPDDKKDYIIYAVDPEETLRANQLRSPGSRGHASPSRPSSSTSSRDRSDAITSKLNSSPPRPKDAATSILVGKGFFNWALEEEGEGDTTVTGRVRSDGRRLRYENGREYEEDLNVLEVVIKLKESQARSKDKYFNLVRGLSSGSSFSAGASSSSSSRTALRHATDVEVVPTPQRFRASRHTEDDSQLSLHSEPDYPTSSTSSYGLMERQIRRPAARLRSADTSGGRTISPKTTLYPLPSTSAASSPSAPSAPSPASALTSAASNPSTLQILTILHSLQQRSSKSAPEPAQQAQLENLLQQVAQVFGSSSSSTPAGDAEEATTAGPSSTSPTLSKRPLDAVPVPNARSPNPQHDCAFPGKENRDLSQSGYSKDTPQSTSDSRRASAASPLYDGDDLNSPSLSRREDTSNRICYNCGTDVPTTWRILKLPTGSVINNPAAEKAAGSDGNIDEAEPGWKPRYAGKDSPVETDGETKWSACNPCGLYYLKWNNSRPEYVWRKEHATKAYRERKALAEAAKRRREHNDMSGPSKRARTANSDIDGASPYAVGTPRDAQSKATFGVDSSESMTSPNLDAATPVSSSGRKDSMPRTLSEACHRDAEKIESQRSGKKKGEKEKVCKKQADREYVLDPSTGKWRSRRSMRENPEGKRPGRPKGSVKVSHNGKPAAKPCPATKESSSTPAAQPLKDESSSCKQPERSADSSGTSSEPQAASHSSSNNQQPRAGQQDSTVQAPMPSQVGRQIPASRMVNFAQSSPVRPSMNASLMQADAINSTLPTFGSEMLESPSRDVRFRVPSYLMNSSPGTMLDTLMSEADFDFEELGPLRPLQTPGTLLGNMTKNGNTPQRLRRSPRKNPHGTISGSNPYASPSAKRDGSPSFLRDIGKQQSARARMNADGSPSRRSNLPSSNDSPVTRSRTRSGQNILHPALYSSSDNLHDKSSSNVTSPASPSEKRTKTASSLHTASKAQLPASKCNAVQTAARRRGGSPDAELDEDGEDQQFIKGPYQSHPRATASRENSAGLPSCPASPSLGRATRKRARNLSPASVASGPAKLAQFDLPPSSPVFDHPTGSEIEVDGWGRTPSMREIFPTPSDLDWPSDASPGNTQSPSKPAEEAEAEAEAEVDNSSAKGEVKDSTNNAPETRIVRRRPLPATVEDASSSVSSGSSPALTEDSPEGNANLFDLLEDPYGILAASGFGIDAEGGLTSIEIPIHPSASGAAAATTSTSTSMTPSSSTPVATMTQPSISADNFTQISLHPKEQFGEHLTEFNSSGGVGVAAHVTEDSVAAAIAIANAAPGSSAIATSSAGTGAGGKTAVAFDTSFLANLPPELSNIFTSPSKPLPPQIIEILASPRKNRSTRTASVTSNGRSSSSGSGGGGDSPMKGGARGGEMVVSPHHHHHYRTTLGGGGGGEYGSVGNDDGGEEAQQEQDLSALFSNPDIQALLAEFEAQAQA
ncbi:uncharacterized protein MEPE_04547 [Melanopsichium pennsylvanicum]|uniref:Ams2/SPT21 N-terminal domain-containing protein n=2 Tax=Melanopsichium pennsylvanicum TaxID=63383 RepID=A0AAJ4XRN6_9BASI|nr:putative protein [Melanopsichium pennsylvanicum 4]SNX85838.1 uncharacterized protein MEPE_04547 [Melanopsichium pennsylvanicum]